MKNVIKAGISLSLLFAPLLTFAATDDQIQASLTQQLLSMFVVEVNALDKMQSLVSQSSNPSQFNNFSALVANQLSQTTAQLATLLNSQGSVSLSPMNSEISTSGSAAAQPTITVVDDKVIVRSNKSGQWSVDLTTNSDISAITINEGGDILETLNPTVNNLYSDGYSHYISTSTPLQNYLKGRASVDFSIIVTADNGATYTAVRRLQAGATEALPF